MASRRRKKNLLDHFLDHPWRTGVKAWSTVQKSRSDWKVESERLRRERDQARRKRETATKQKQARRDQDRKRREEARAARYQQAQQRFDARREAPGQRFIVQGVVADQSAKATQKPPAATPNGRPVLKAVNGGGQHSHAPLCGAKTDDGSPCQNRGACPHHKPGRRRANAAKRGDQGYDADAVTAWRLLDTHQP